jgi:hypothetical protein
MAKMFKLLLPHGQQEITIGLQYGNVTLKHEQILPESDIVKLYPQFFFPILEETVTPVVEVAPEVIETQDIVRQMEVNKPIEDEQPKKKAGRPFGTKKK